MQHRLEALFELILQFGNAFHTEQKDPEVTGLDCSDRVNLATSGV